MGGRGGSISSGRAGRTGSGVGDVTVKDGTFSVDSSSVMSDAYFSSAGELLRTIRKADGGRYDVLDNRNEGDYGSIMYTDAYSSDGLAYDVYWDRDYSDPKRKRIRIREFRVLEEGEW